MTIHVCATRFNEETWRENENYRKSRDLKGCIYGSPKKISNNINSLGAGVTFDFADIRGYQYHKGIVFTAYADGFTSSVAQGGRYDNLNESLGLKRPATGFSLDLRYLINNL